MSDTVGEQVELYPTLDKNGAFKLDTEISDKLNNIYRMIDDTTYTEDIGEVILDEYYAAMLKTVEEVLATPVGNLMQRLNEMLEEVYHSMQVNYDAASKDFVDMLEQGAYDSKESEEVMTNDACSVEESRKDPLIEVIGHSKIGNVTPKFIEEDLTDEEMLETLAG